MRRGLNERNQDGWGETLLSAMRADATTQEKKGQPTPPYQQRLTRRLAASSNRDPFD